MYISPHFKITDKEKSSSLYISQLCQTNSSQRYFNIYNFDYKFGGSEFIFYFYFIFNFFKHLYWSIIALQWCVSFCFITEWISYTYTYIPISPSSCISLPPSLSHPSRCSQSTSWSPCAMWLLPTIYFTFDSVYMSMPLSWWPRRMSLGVFLPVLYFGRVW